MKPSVYYGVILHPNVPKELLAALDGYLYSSGDSGLLFLLSWTADHASNFVGLEIVHKTDGKPHWKVQLPVSYILVIADMSGKKKPAGFVQNSGE